MVGKKFVVAFICLIGASQGEDCTGKSCKDCVDLKECQFIGKEGKSKDGKCVATGITEGEKKKVDRAFRPLQGCLFVIRLCFRHS